MMPVDFVVAIPARFHSTRLPGKPLRLIGGVPMICRVAQQALMSGASQVVVATDDDRICSVLAGSGATICMTASKHRSGMDRLAECATSMAWAAETIVVNLQGDEPFAPPAGIQAVAEVLSRSDLPMATLACPFTDCDTFFDPNTVKVVADSAGKAIYFSRAPIPWHRERLATDRISDLAPAALRHIGIYAYRCAFLRSLAALPPSPLELIESLEQLRALEAGHGIAVGLSPAEFPPGVDTESDLARANRLAAKA